MCILQLTEGFIEPMGMKKKYDTWKYSSIANAGSGNIQEATIF